jgi:soluble lytic murein transglycosylase-like protein
VDASESDASITELALACGRSRRRALGRRTAAARRAARVRYARRALAVLAVWSVSIVVTAPVASAPEIRLEGAVTTAPGATPCGIPRPFVAAFRAASRRTALPLSLLAAVAWEESRMKPTAVSPVGARGLLQLMPGTGKIVGIRATTPRTNVLAGARYLRLMLDRFPEDPELALAAYNAGPTAVANAGEAPTIGTLRYVKNIELREATLAHCT